MVESVDTVDIVEVLSEGTDTETDGPRTGKCIGCAIESVPKIQTRCIVDNVESVSGLAV